MSHTLGASRAGRYCCCLLWRQFHKVPVLHNAGMVLCFWINIDESGALFCYQDTHCFIFTFSSFLWSGMIRLLPTGESLFMMQWWCSKNIFQGEMQKAVYHSQGRSSAWQYLLTCNIYISVITSQDVLLIKVYCKMNLNDGGSHGSVDLRDLLLIYSHMEMGAKQYFINVIKTREGHWASVSSLHICLVSCWKNNYTLIIHVQHQGLIVTLWESLDAHQWLQTLEHNYVLIVRKMVCDVLHHYKLMLSW